MTICWWIIEQVATTALLVAAVALVCRLLSNRPAAEHLLWLVVLARFMAPPGLAWHVTAPDWLRQPAAQIAPREPAAAVPVRVALSDSAGEMVLPPADVDPDPALWVPLGALEPAWSSAEAPRMPAPEQQVARPAEINRADDERSGQQSWQHSLQWTVSGANCERLLCAVWLMGGLVVAWRSGGRIVRFARLVRQGEKAGEDLTAEVRRLAELMGLPPVKTRTATGIASPFVWCWGRATLVWPANSADKADLTGWEGVLAHELAHVRRRDHWTAWLELLASIVWWWNPLLWFVRGRLRQSAEAACDALALSVLPDGRQAYAEAFLALAQLPRGGEPAPALGVAWRGGMNKSFERRLAMILSQRVESRVSLAALAAIAVMAVVAIPSWSLSWAEPPAVATEAAPATGEAPPTEATPPSDAAPAIESATKIEGPAATEGNQTPATEPAADVPTVTYDALPDPASPAPKVEEGAAKELKAAVDEARAPPTLEMKMFAGARMELAWPSEEIVRVRVSYAPVLAVTAESKHKIRVSALQAGTARIALWSFEKQVANLQVTVATPIDLPAMKNAEALDFSAPARGRAFLPHQMNPPATAPPRVAPKRGTAPLVPPSQPPPAASPPNQAPTGDTAPLAPPGQRGAVPVWQPTLQSDDPLAVPFGQAEGAASRTRDIDVTNLGLAIIEAQGEKERMEIELASLKRLQDGHIVSRGELRLGEIKEETARHKLEFLVRLAQKAYDSAQRQRNFQRQVWQRTEALRQQGRLPAAQVTETERDFNAAEERVKLIEMIPGIKSEKTSPPADDKPAP